MKFTLIISGSGGQGVMSVGISLASSAVEGGLHATFMPLYGPEQRGGSAKCTVIVSDKEIVSLKLDTPRPLIFGDVVVRVSPKFAAACHIDTDESNAAGCGREVYGEIVK